MAKVILEDGVEEAILGYYFNLPFLDQVRLIWAEPAGVRAASPLAGRPEVELRANWGDLEDWFTDLQIYIRFPKRRFRLSGTGMYLEISPDSPWMYRAQGMRWQDVDVEDRRFFPTLEEAKEILEGDGTHPRLGEALLAYGRRRPAGEIELIRRFCDSSDRAVRLVALGAAAWYFDETAREIVSGALEDPEQPIRAAAEEYIEDLERDPGRKRWMLGIDRTLPDGDPGNWDKAI